MTVIFAKLIIYFHKTNLNEFDCMCRGGMGRVERGGGLSLPPGTAFGNKWENDTLLLYKAPKIAIFAT